ncbi:hypothetical protein Thit_1885 [Thermoanaerobacter italicus Ab9]|uniref:Uncharacterized protein n=1 Tax=Thermoanaerobacter italicus (strain DSM 9252 / Ab9) TaxID=580331 RepID=D3T4H5_THEIA|nr:hypothetical protein [Thermoanaerobacter italicus]ADD03127.1 hypothetical protein Thit_1885 [Thermoanaerobacter italicus Ab9]
MILYIEKNCIESYAKAGCDVIRIIPFALHNLERAASRKKYTIKHTELTDNYVVRISIPDICFNFERFSDGKADASDIVNFALKLYLPIYKREQKKAKIKKAFDEAYMSRLFKELDMEITETEIDNERERIYYYTICPACGMERFYFSLDLANKNVFVGCINFRCSFYNRNCVDIISFLIKQYNKTFAEAIEFLAEICEQKTEAKNSKFMNTPFYTKMTLEDFRGFGFDKEIVSKCFIVPKGEGENPIVYMNKGERDHVYVIVYDVLCAMRIRKNNEDVNIIGVYSNTISEEQLKIICDCVPKQSKIILGFGNDVWYEDLNREAKKLREEGYQQVEVADIPLQFNNFADMMFDDPEIERKEVNRALKLF